MSISISTAKYINEKIVEIDGEEFKMRLMSTTEALECARIGKKIQKSKDDSEIELDDMQRPLEIIIGLFDKPEKIRKIFSKMPINAVMEVYEEIAES